MLTKSDTELCTIILNRWASRTRRAEALTTLVTRREATSYEAGVRYGHARGSATADARRGQ
jgi:hypothetical protein